MDDAKAIKNPFLKGRESTVFGWKNLKSSFS
jgi:hypothetical protein